MGSPGYIRGWIFFAASAGAASGLLCCVAPAAQPSKHTAMQLTSTAFAEGQPIPAKHTCDARDLSPPLQWTGVPTGAKSLVLLVNDPDAPVGDWVHWVVFDLPSTAKGLPEDLPKGQYLPAGGKQGLNDFRRLGYGGPCPPPGKAHRYFFRLYALDTVLDLKPGVTRKEVQQAMAGHELAEGQLMGTYQRK